MSFRKKKIESKTAVNFTRVCLDNNPRRAQNFRISVVQDKSTSLNGLEEISDIDNSNNNEKIKSSANIPNPLLITDENPSRKIFSYTSQHNIRNKEDASAMSQER